MPIDDFIDNTRSLSISNFCPVIFDKETGSYSIDKSKIDNITDEERYNYNLVSSNDYYKEVENGNTYINNLLDKEEKYFINKYGEKIYEYLKKLRNNYIEEKIASKTIIGSDDDDIYYDGTSGTFDGVNTDYSEYIKEFYKKEKNSLNSVYDVYKNTLFENINTNLERRKIYYRTKELTNISYINAISNILYYFIVISILIGLFVKNSLNLNNRYKLLFYIFIFIFPLIYNYFYNILVFMVKKIYNLLVDNIPKYSFKNNLKFHDDDYYTKDYF